MPRDTPSRARATSRRPRRSATPPAKPPAPAMTALQVFRAVALLTAPSGALTQSAVRARASELAGRRLSKSTVRGALMDEWRSPFIERAFCELTETEASLAFPDDPSAEASQAAAAAALSQLHTRTLHTPTPRPTEGTPT